MFCDVSLLLGRCLGRSAAAVASTKYLPPSAFESLSAGMCQVQDYVCTSGFYLLCAKCET